MYFNLYCKSKQKSVNLCMISIPNIIGLYNNYNNYNNYNIDFIDIYQMKREIRDRLRSQSNAELAQSIVYLPGHNKSIIHELGDLIDEQNSSNDYNHQQRNSLPLRNGFASMNTFHSAKPFRNKNNNLISQIQPEPTLIRYNKNKIDYVRRSEHISQIRSPISHLKNNNLDEKRSPFKENMYEIQKEDNYYFKIKYDYNKSFVVKNRQFIENNLLEKCQNCGQPKSQIFRNSLVCKNKKCRQMKLFQNFQTFPLIGIFYQIQNPSSTCEQLQDTIKKLNQQIARIEKQRQSLIQIQFQLQSIIEQRKQHRKLQKSHLKQIMNTINQFKFKKGRQIQSRLQEIRKKIQNFQFSQIYQQFSRWNTLSIQNSCENKSIIQNLNKHRPLCLKQIQNQIAQYIATISDNFNSSLIDINSTQNLGFNFTNNIDRMFIHIDGSIHVKRDNFLLIQNLKQMRLIFKNRKTSRQLRQLFNILPPSMKLKLQFDYKEHSHVSSETFPILTKACQIAQSQLQISLFNARPQVFQDLIEASKTIKAKSTVNINININSYAPQGEWPEYSRSKQWGTKLLKTLFSNLGKRIIKIDLQLPIRVNLQQISQFILNSDYSMLIQFKLKTLNQEIEDSQNLKKLLKTIVNKKVALVGLIANKKRHIQDPLNKNYRLCESVFRTLF